MKESYVSTLTPQVNRNCHAENPYDCIRLNKEKVPGCRNAMTKPGPVFVEAVYNNLEIKGLLSLSRPANKLLLTPV